MLFVFALNLRGHLPSQRFQKFPIPTSSPHFASMNEKVKIEILDHDDPRNYGNAGPEFPQEPFGNEFHSGASFSGWRPSGFSFSLLGCMGMICLALLLLLASAAFLILLPVFILFSILLPLFRFRGFAFQKKGRAGNPGNFSNSANFGDPPLFIKVFHSENWKK